MFSCIAIISHFQTYLVHTYLFVSNQQGRKRPAIRSRDKPTVPTFRPKTRSLFDTCQFADSLLAFSSSFSSFVHFNMIVIWYALVHQPDG